MEQPAAPPDLAALDTLSELKEKLNGEKISIRDAAAGLSFALRKYIEARLCVPACEQTTVEVLKHA